MREHFSYEIDKTAIRFIESNQERHWCLYLTHFAVHTPIQPKKELVPKYSSKPPGTLHQDVRMATMIQAIDDGIGRIMKRLDELRLTSKTVVLFYSDNGGYGPVTDMAPLKGYKGTYYEGGIRVPFFVNWPGVVKPNQTNAEPITGVDFYPTLCEIGGASLPANQPMDEPSRIFPLVPRGGSAAPPVYTRFLVHASQSEEEKGS